MNNTAYTNMPALYIFLYINDDVICTPYSGIIRIKLSIWYQNDQTFFFLCSQFFYNNSNHAAKIQPRTA